MYGQMGTKYELMNALRERGYVKADDSKETLSYPGGAGHWDSDKQEYVYDDPETEKNMKFWDLLEAPVYAEYGSFAGEFYVNGTIFVDVTAGTMKMSKDEEVSHYEHNEYDL